MIQPGAVIMRWSNPLPAPAPSTRPNPSTCTRFTAHSASILKTGIPAAINPCRGSPARLALAHLKMVRRQRRRRSCISTRLLLKAQFSRDSARVMNTDLQATVFQKMSKYFELERIPGTLGSHRPCHGDSPLRFSSRTARSSIPGKRTRLSPRKMTRRQRNRKISLRQK